MSNYIYRLPAIQGGILPPSRGYLGVCAIPIDNKHYAIKRLTFEFVENFGSILTLISVGSGLDKDAFYLVADRCLSEHEKKEAVHVIENEIFCLRRDGIDVQYKYTHTPYKNAGYSVSTRVEAIQVMDTFYCEDDNNNIVVLAEKGDMYFKGSQAYNDLIDKLTKMFGEDNDSWKMSLLWGTWTIGV